MHKKLLLLFLVVPFFFGCDLFDTDRTVTIESDTAGYTLFVDGSRVDSETIIVKKGNHSLLAFLEGYNVIQKEITVEENATVNLEFTAMTTILADDFTDNSNIGTENLNYTVLEGVENPVVTNSLLTLSPIADIAAEDHMWIMNLRNDAGLSSHSMAVHMEIDYDIENCGDSLFFHLIDGSRISDNAHIFYHLGFGNDSSEVSIQSNIEATEGTISSESSSYSYDPTIFIDGNNAIDLVMTETDFILIVNDNLLIDMTIPDDMKLNTAEIVNEGFGFGVHGPAIADDIIIDALNCYK
ncbi:MAG: PEGA domain-containing protein [Spirochaetales bacterium]|nr:PEGA domain-containing protein [Spirochaetales bacterium]